MRAREISPAKPRSLTSTSKDWLEISGCLKSMEQLMRKRRAGASVASLSPSTTVTGFLMTR